VQTTEVLCVSVWKIQTVLSDSHLSPVFICNKSLQASIRYDVCCSYVKEIYRTVFVRI